MRRTVAGALPVLLAIGVAWDRVEQPRASPLLVAASVAAIGPALSRSRVTRAVLAAALLVAVATLAAREWPWAALSEVVDGAREAGGVASPYDPGVHASLHVAVALVVVTGALVTSLAVGGRRPLLAGGVAAVMVAWPATLANAATLPWGCLALAVALWPSVALRAPSRAMAVAGVGALGLVLAGTALAAGRGLAPGGDAAVEWRGWNPLGGDGERISVRYVWDADYGGIAFPSEPTVVFRVRAAKRALYWRASTLDTFLGDRWIENLYPREISSPRQLLPVDPLLPPRAARPAGWLRQEVVIGSLAESRLVAASQPMRIVPDGIGRLHFLSGGVIAADEPAGAGARYTVWSYAPSPSPRELAESPPRYPADAARYLELGRARLPAFGAQGRAGTVERLLADERYPDLAPYAALWREARRLANGTASPYVATLAIERWLRSGGGFTYDERPAAPPAGVPPLAYFAGVGRAGYCQHFAGTMALALRLLGIPSRVAVGFSSGRRVDDEWVVSDHDAHAWVEVWLAGHGWLPFDPTPGRGTLSASYTLASDSADAVRALGTGRFLDFDPEETTTAPTAPSQVDERAAGGEQRVPVGLLIAVVLPALACIAIVGAKVVRRRRRLGAGDPRRVAAAVRLELADVLRDHGAAIRAGASMPELGAVAARTLGVPADGLVAATDEARYAPPGQARGAAASATRELGLLLAGARRRLGLRRTLAAALSVRSLRRLDTPGTMGG